MFLGQGHKTASANELAMKIKDNLTKRLLFMENMRAGIQATMDDVTKQVRDIREYKVRIVTLCIQKPGSILNPPISTLASKVLLFALIS